jgi:hypothetical protein
MKRLAIVFCSLLVVGCAALVKPEKTQPPPYRYAADGSVIWGEEFQFAPPPKVWKLVQVDSGDEFGFAFLKMCQQSAICQSTFAYDEEPFGASRDLGKRMKEFYSRFLWATRIQFGPLQTRETTAAGREALSAVAEGRDDVMGEKVMTKVVLTHRGERVVGFYLTQWRSVDGVYDEQELKDFDAFVASFRFIRPSFFETL